MILVIKHVAIEGPGTLGEFFESIRKKEVKTVELEKSEPLPDKLSNIEAMVVLGGPMNVYEEDAYPFLKEENTLLKKALMQNIPVLGICLGAQLLAKAAGATVKKADQKEIGWYDINLTENGKKDPFFKDVNTTLRVFQWHEDTFDMPQTAELLATSEICRNQAFRIGRYAYGLQFHAEVTEAIIKRWQDEYLNNPDVSLKIKAGSMIKEYRRTKERFNQQARQMYLNFLSITEAGK